MRDINANQINTKRNMAIQYEKKEQKKVLWIASN